jgi:sugar/nucleoside kinase (ribokinase family)
MQLPVPAQPRTGRAFDVVGIGLNASDTVVVVPHFPEFDAKVEITSHQLMFGGQVATAMVGMQRLGFKSRYIGRVGSDHVGGLQIASIEAEGVECSELRVVEGVQSQIAIILVEAGSGERTIMWRRDPKLTIRPDELSRDVVCSGRVLHLDGHNIEAEVRAATWAREAAIPVTIDVDKDYDGAALYPLVDYLTTSEEFPARVTGAAEPRAALAALHDRFGCPFVAMTRGRRGALALCEGRYVESPGFVVEARDTTGAGDAFRVGFLYGLLEGLSVEETLRAANAVAALNCRELGARGGLPTRVELEAFLTTGGTE